MKVMCISENFLFFDGFEPKVGEILTAHQCPVYEADFDIIEYPFDSKGNPQSFRKNNFAPLSDIDEMELVNERELVNQ